MTLPPRSASSSATAGRADVFHKAVRIITEIKRKSEDACRNPRNARPCFLRPKSGAVFLSKAAY
ncbi:hypothetical protein ABIB80_007058 [Bradyrhizobium sp. i1.15.2]